MDEKIWPEILGFFAWLWPYLGPRGGVASYI